MFILVIDGRNNVKVASLTLITHLLIAVEIHEWFGLRCWIETNSIESLALIFHENRTNNFRVKTSLNFELFFPSCIINFNELALFLH